MVQSSIRNRIKQIQTHLGLISDGVMGPKTLTAIEGAVFGSQSSTLLDSDAETLLRISSKGVDLILFHEISSKAYYQKFLSSPSWPGGGSGITIGVGYDLGYHTQNQISKDWAGLLSFEDLDLLFSASGKKGGSVSSMVQSLSSVKISYAAAAEVFYSSTLNRYARKLQKAYPGCEDLFPDAQGALLSLVYNRGTAMAGERRKEMAAIKPLVAAKDYQGMAEQILSMKRLWQGKGLNGLLRRRDEEAGLILGADRDYDPVDIIRI